MDNETISKTRVQYVVVEMDMKLECTPIFRMALCRTNLGKMIARVSTCACILMILSTALPLPFNNRSVPGNCVCAILVHEKIPHMYDQTTAARNQASSHLQKIANTQHAMTDPNTHQDKRVCKYWLTKLAQIHA